MKEIIESGIEEKCHQRSDDKKTDAQKNQVFLGIFFEGVNPFFHD